MTTTTSAMTNGRDEPFNGEDDFMDGLEKIAGILTGVAGKLDVLADSFGTSEEELAKLNAGKSKKEIEREDAIAAQIAAPLVNALDSMSAILNGANEEIMDMIFDVEPDADEETEVEPNSINIDINLDFLDEEDDYAEEEE